MWNKSSHFCLNWYVRSFQKGISINMHDIFYVLQFVGHVCFFNFKVGRIQVRFYIVIVALF